MNKKLQAKDLINVGIFKIITLELGKNYGRISS